MTILDWINKNIKCQVYDYSKALNRRNTKEYYITYSLSERNREQCRKILAEGRGNVAVVFNVKKRGDFPSTFMGRPVINGDEHDLRFLDKSPGYVIGLSAKGDGKRNKNGFVIYAGDKDLDRPSDNYLLSEPDISSTPRREKFASYAKTIDFSKDKVFKRINYFIRKKYSLLSVGNPKLDKGEKYGYYTFGLSLAPAGMNGFTNFCPNHTSGCLSSCLYTSGNMLSYKNKVTGRLTRSWIFLFKRDYFFTKLQKELKNSYKICLRDGMKMAVRLNVYSDLPWHNIII